jgi:NAD(P)-dependent dehydrogenase (short-subunit alcohol dehydrogenase family)
MTMDKRVFITGTTRGIGRELVKQLCGFGCSVFATGRDAVLLESLRDETHCLTATADLSDPNEVQRIYAMACEALGPIDVLVNNAGLNQAKDAITDIRLNDWELQYAVNLRAPFLLSQAALRDMGARRSGHILNVISSIAKRAQQNYATYCTMKHALAGFTSCLIREAREQNVKVTAVYPGGVDTDFREIDRPDYMTAASTARMIVHCIMAPEDVVVHDLTFRPMVEDLY